MTIETTTPLPTTKEPPSALALGTGSTFLCENETCERHCLVKWDSELAQRNEGRGLRFCEGFQTAVVKIDLVSAAPKDGVRLCRECRGAYNMALLKLTPKPSMLSRLKAWLRGLWSNAKVTNTGA